MLAPVVGEGTNAVGVALDDCVVVGDVLASRGLGAREIAPSPTGPAWAGGAPPHPASTVETRNLLRVRSFMRALPFV